MKWTKDNVLNWDKKRTDDQYAKLAASRNKRYRLMFRRPSAPWSYEPWEFGIDSHDEVYLRERGQEWYRLGFIKEWKLVPVT